jgi:adenine deaminase
MSHLIEVAKGDAPADLLLKDARVVNVFTGEVYSTHVAVAGKWIAGVGKEYREAR